MHGKNIMSFHYKNGYLYCEELRVKDIQEQVPYSPFYLYSLAQLEANYTLHISKHLRESIRL